ncbi:uncharacterized protein MYCFIDRAFT_197824 [Pseudocercospora fijiensis CIRAD86]|uniref:Uncharacterized protein n=1 Tax=Pseudocercospora fijiensis (strain CIRAD86) TaxID=383855 RepID=M3ATZ6_PSEFD|nr:uncharacterized protein MYCFIDRAFT_197824 [Pseudocercospora fijiensis CIRAD86]EME80967.1 hypothetical protein MYCFIDRAFT_197824 [Pseudocercospora fijiensis CIRAD86]
MTFMLLALSSLAIPTFAQDALKAVLVGRPQPIATLIPQPSAVPLDHFRPPNISEIIESPDDRPTKDIISSTHTNEDDGEPEPPSFLRADPDEVHDEFSAYVPYGEANGQTLVKRSLTKRAAFRGTMMMNCKKAREACQNACWYQNCVRGAQGSTTAVTYTYDSSSNNDENRVQAGTTVTRGTPCAAWPFGQRFWDMYPWSRQKPTKDSQRQLQTDEWPMADFKNDPFDPTANPPQHSLRCITAEDNSKGSKQWVNFRDGAGHYKAGKKYESKRLGTSRFVTGDTFHVEFDMSEFDDTNADDVKAKTDLLSYCTPPSYNSCQNDGRQFHMSALVQTSTRQLQVGTLEWPYDANSHNKYRIDGEKDDIKAYFVTVEVTGDDGDFLKASAQTYVDGDYQDLDRADSRRVGVGGEVSLKGDLPQELKVRRVDGAGCTTELEFVYGSPDDGTLDWFVFKSDAKGYGRWSWIESGSQSGKYCQVEEMKDDEGDYVGTKFFCTFPGW